MMHIDQEIALLEAEANIAAALDWLLEVGSADDEPAIKAGSMSIDEEGTDDDDAE